ncbi:hypothetical protein NA56DRAFT_209244 [Hyaloscypha hepaticicola]|uniref:Uncharacterized protein n=1 Tax=Hyaloscypha hepaticicola TaxID=2082293 RepID=A0A2J6PXZ0_9HELO|nr:hypothetical protein NA56DRAFT_209244 [Hyaloscypha hepaticicola]
MRRKKIICAVKGKDSSKHRSIFCFRDLEKIGSEGWQARLEDHTYYLLVIARFEAFHGKYPLANRQIITGMSLIYKLRATFSNELPTRFKFPEPNVLDMIWYRRLGDLNHRPAPLWECTTGSLLHRSEKLLYEPLARMFFHVLRSNSFATIP